MARRRDPLATGSMTTPVAGAGSDNKRFPVVAIGASAGGLDALQNLFDAMPDDTGMAFIIIQHLDPTHASMMVELLTGHTAMTVQQATDGMQIERDNVYVMPPGYFLSVGDGALRLTKPDRPHGVRLPFDFLLHSLAMDVGDRAICVILSGTGLDGSAGLKSVKEAAGLVIAEDPDEAAFDGMPRSAIMTGQVDLVLRIAEMPDAIGAFTRKMAFSPATSPVRTTGRDFFAEVIELLRSEASHDFSTYKRGTLERRIERRRAMMSEASGSIEDYIKILRSDAREIDLLVKDLLINVTSFFRDPEMYEQVSAEIIPAMLRDRKSSEPLRIWSAGCSSGEEAYSLAMLFAEAITEAKSEATVQIFGSDADADAIGSARAGIYPESIETEVSPERLARFFSKEDGHYRCLPELRDKVIFATHDILKDPPFSRLDLISCRNVLIYLNAEAQSHVFSFFHFALRAGGLLLLGGSEMVGDDDKRFAIISKPLRLYRHTSRALPGEMAQALNVHGARVPALPGRETAPPRKSVYADLCSQIIFDNYAPAAILVDRALECLYMVGPTDRYLRVPAGSATQSLAAMLRQVDLRSKLRSAVMRSVKTMKRVLVSGGRAEHSDGVRPFSLAVHPVAYDGEQLALICFIEQPESAKRPRRENAAKTDTEVAELEQELESTRGELQSVTRNLEETLEEQGAINEEALSVNEEFQSANEELLTSKEELQSLNEELTALNGQLQETLESQRRTSDDLQNVLFCTDVATIFLDMDLNIRFFTPAARRIFNFISSDVGRPLSDLHSLIGETDTLFVARAVLQSLLPVEDQVHLDNGEWFDRRILPYRTSQNEIEGVVVTFSNATARKRAEEILAVAQKQAEDANIAKSRFLAAASHDLRQPLQTLSLIQGLLAMIVQDEKAKKLVGRLDTTLVAMSGMLNTLLDINQIDTGTVRVELTTFPIGDLLGKLHDEFSYLAASRGLDFRMVPCSLSVSSDRQLLEQVLRNLISNALKYTKSGKVLFGCRRLQKSVRVEICDTGNGIPEAELEAIFNEYHQLENSARELSRGLGLGLSIVQRLAGLLGHKVAVRSKLGKGSVFSVDVSLPGDSAPALRKAVGLDVNENTPVEGRIFARLLVVDDDPDVVELLEILLTREGHEVMTARDGDDALAEMAKVSHRPDLILTDLNLPGNFDGLELAEKIRSILHRTVPVIILTGDISDATRRNIGQRHDFVLLNKPLKSDQLLRAVQQALVAAQPVDA
jgi:two-component system CheB/CheR fusion protein